MHIASATGNSQWLSLSSFEIHKQSVSNLIAVVTGVFLLGVSFLGFGALPLTSLDISFLAPSLPGLVLTVIRKVTFLRAQMIVSILREHNQIQWHWT